MGIPARRIARPRRVAVALAIALLAWPLLASAQPGGQQWPEWLGTPAERAEINAVIRRQLEAFARNDAQAAFRLASPGVQARFGTPEAFMAMVRQAYRPVYRHEIVRFMGLRRRNGRLIQYVLFTEANGSRWLAVYPMRRDARGEWRIDGCYLMAYDRPSA